MREYFVLDFPNNAQGDTFLTGVRCAGMWRWLIAGFFVESPGRIGFVYLGRLRGRGRFFQFAFPSSAGAITSSTSVYGPNWLGNGFVSVVGAYTTFQEPDRTFGFLFRGSLQGVGRWRSVNPPDAVNTVLRSTVDPWAVGNYDTSTELDKGFLYNIPRALFQDVVKPGSELTTCNGITRHRAWFLICGEFRDPGGVLGGYVVELRAGGMLRNWREFHYNDDPTQPTHFNGITSENDAVFVTGDAPVSFLLRYRGRRPNEWQELRVPNSLTTSSQSVSNRAVVGFFTRADDSFVHGFTSRPS